jgi:hypothetical protein
MGTNIVFLSSVTGDAAAPKERRLLFAAAW